MPGDGVVIVSVFASGYCGGGIICLASDVFPAGFTLTLSPGIWVDGRLVSDAGVPVGDAVLQVTALAWGEGQLGGNWGKSLQEWAWVPTDHEGFFTLTVDEPGKAVIVVRSMSQGEATFSDVHLEPGVLAELHFPAPLLSPARSRSKMARPPRAIMFASRATQR